MRLRGFAFVLLLPILLVTCLTGCDWLRNIRGDVREQDDIQAALRKYLQQRGNLKLDAMDMQIVEFNTDRDSADLEVEFRAKEGGGKMRVAYHLERTNGIWEVKKSQPLSGAPPAGEPTPSAAPPLPPGHPPKDSSGKKPAPVPQAHP